MTADELERQRIRVATADVINRTLINLRDGMEKAETVVYIAFTFPKGNKDPVIQYADLDSDRPHNVCWAKDVVDLERKVREALIKILSSQIADLESRLNHL